MRYNLNLNGDEINLFGPESDLNKGGHVTRRGPLIQLKLKLGQKRNYGKKTPIFLVLIEREREREEKRERGELRLPPKIYGVLLVDFRLANNEILSHRRGVREGTLKEGFIQRSKRGDFKKSKLSVLGGFLPVYHSPRGKVFFFSWLTFHLWVEKRGFSFKGLFGEEKLDFRGFARCFFS